ncbi:MAG: ABC transporter ATP-binding protein [Anaerolineales bacterium]
MSERDIKNADDALIVRNINKQFRGKADPAPFWHKRAQPMPIRAVQDVSFRVKRNEIYGILGPNGSGKSTLIRLLCTLLIPDTGSVSVFGHDVERQEMHVRRLINRVSVDAAFFKKLSPRENLLYGARLYGVPAPEADRKAREILTRLGLRASSYNAPMEDMSRGMQQKVAIARAFLSQPILLLLDEPTTGLDPRSKREVQEVVLELRDTHDATIIITTHDMGEAEALCDRIAILDEGAIVAEDTPTGLKARVPAVNGHAPTLEDVFMELTGKRLTEDDEAQPAPMPQSGLRSADEAVPQAEPEYTPSMD